MQRLRAIFIKNAFGALFVNAPEAARVGTASFEPAALPRRDVSRLERLSAIQLSERLR